MADWQHELQRVVDEQFADMVALRRHLHQHPELSGEEYQTSLLLYQRFTDEQLSVRMGPEGRGIIVDLDAGWNGSPGGVFALRADIDALEIEDEKQVVYRSRCPGIMHACGHDAHTAIVTGALMAIHRLAQDGHLPVSARVRGVFQPAEESCRGAREMIEAGALDGVSAILAAHVDPSRPLGRIGLRSGVLTANCDDMHIVIRGRGGHAGRPHEARDPISAAAQMINWLYLQIPRATDSQDAVVITIGKIVGGHHSNVIPERVDLHGTLRTLDREIRLQTMDHVRRLATAVAAGSKTRIEVEFGVGTHGIENDPGLVGLVYESCQEIIGPEGVDAIERPSMGSEDFAFYCERVPGAMFRLGCVSERAGGSGLHTPTFDVDEEILRIGAQIMAATVIRWLMRHRTDDQPPDVAGMERGPAQGDEA